MKEKSIVKRIRKMLDKEFPGAWYKIHGGPHQEKGIPDIIGVHEGVFWGFEVKTPKRRDKVTKYQDYQLQRIAQAGGKSTIVCSPDEARKFIEENLL